MVVPGRKENFELKAKLGYIVRLYLKKNITKCLSLISEEPLTSFLASIPIPVKVISLPSY
jgi:hypothetical protein